MGAKLTFSERFTARLQKIRKEGSPYYLYTPGIIAAGADEYFHVDTSFPLSRKYAPLDWIEITNNDSVALTITINGTQPFPCPAGTIRTIDEMPIRSVNVHNDDGATGTTAGLVRITLQRQTITSDRFVRRFA